jgi:hypothetical protein
MAYYCPSMARFQEKLKGSRGNYNKNENCPDS